MFLMTIFLAHIPVVDQTNLYARLHPFGQINYQWNSLTADKLGSFVGVVISAGLVYLPSFKEVCCKDFEKFTFYHTMCAV